MNEDIYQPQEGEDITWSHYVNERAKKLFGTTDLEDERVCAFVVMQAQRDNKTVTIQKSDCVPYEQWEVVINDEENTVWHFCPYVSELKSDCMKWVVDNELEVID